MGRYQNAKSRSQAFGRIYLDSASVFGDDSVADRQPQAGSAAQRFGCEEGVKYFLQMLRRNSAAGVTEFNGDHALRLRVVPARSNRETAVLHCVERVRH